MNKDELTRDLRNLALAIYPRTGAWEFEILARVVESAWAMDDEALDAIAAVAERAVVLRRGTSPAELDHGDEES